LAIWNLNKGYQPVKTSYSAHPSLVPSQLFPTRNGYIIVMCNKEKFFPVLCQAIGVPHLAADERYVNFEMRLANKDSLVAELLHVFAQEDTEFWLELLKGKVPAAPVNTVEEGLKHPLLQERNMIVNVEHPAMGPLRMIGTPIKVSGYDPGYRAAPSLGGDNKEIYGSMLGLSAEEIDKLAEDHII
jgi:crotonobetainyl-CoA:carnitine CoA-transferase CaiB-like acyl-CoA transferase